MEHIVVRGETLAGIAARYSVYGVTMASIAQANGLVNPNFIFAGQRLKIPAYTTDGGVTYGTGTGGWMPITTPATTTTPNNQVATLAAIEAAKKKKEKEDLQLYLLLGGAGLLVVVLLTSGGR
jgi:hypothetical protein